MMRLKDTDVRATARDRAPAEQRPAAIAPPRSTDAVLRLQRTAGNAAVQRALARTETAAAGEESTLGAAEDWLLPPTEGEKNDTGASPGAIQRWLSWAGIGTADLLAELVGFCGFEDFDISADFLRHYMSGRGADYELTMPADWQEAVVRKHGKKGFYKDVSAYDMGVPDMKNSLGHFDLEVKEIAGGGKLYTVTDTYHFPATVGKGKAVQHGFEVDFFGLLPAGMRKGINDQLTKLGTWQHPSGFKERFEVVMMGGTWTFIVPQQFLVDSGVDFPVHAEFVAFPGQFGEEQAPDER